eukprot:SAG11_NODE_2243_length_3641_cov_2.533597_2_plen_530_part_00
MAFSILDALAFKSISDVQLSPDGSQFAFVSADNHLKDVERTAHSSIFLCPTAPVGSPVKLTSGASDSLPRWAPDGRSLAFLSARGGGGQRQIMLLQVPPGTAGEGEDGAKPLTAVSGAIPTPRGLNAVQWAPDGRSIVFLLECAPEAEGGKAEGDTIEYEPTGRAPFVRVMRVSLATGEVDCISPKAAGQIWEFAPGPGGLIAAVVSESPYEWSWYACRLVAFSAGGGEGAAMVELASPAAVASNGKQRLAQSRQVAQPAWSPDGGRIAFVTSTWSDRGCVAGTLMVVSADGSGPPLELTPRITASLGWSVWEEGGRSLLCIGHERQGSGLHRVAADGSGSTPLWWAPDAVAEGNWPRFSLGGGWLAIIKESSAAPRDVWIAACPPAGRPSELMFAQATALHTRQAEKVAVPRAEHVAWAGADGWPMQGLHFAPCGGGDVAPPPTVMYVHGGPIGVQTDRYYPASPSGPVSIALLQQAGYAVFSPNYRGRSASVPPPAAPSQAPTPPLHTECAFPSAAQRSPSPRTPLH